MNEKNRETWQERFDARALAELQGADEPFEPAPDSILAAIQQFDRRRVRAIDQLERTVRELQEENKRLQNEALSAAQANSRALLESALGGAFCTKAEREVLDAARAFGQSSETYEGPLANKLHHLCKALK